MPRPPHAPYRNTVISNKPEFLLVYEGYIQICCYRYKAAKLFLSNWAANGPIVQPADDTGVNIEER